MKYFRCETVLRGLNGVELTESRLLQSAATNSDSRPHARRAAPTSALPSAPIEQETYLRAGATFFRTGEMLSRIEITIKITF